MVAGRLIGGVLPYVTFLVFAWGIVYRITRWNRARSTKIPLFPAPSGPAGKWNRIAKEVLIFKGALEGDKSLWVGTWIFHAALAFILMGHVRVVMDFPVVWGALGLDKGGVDSVSAVLGESAGLILLGTGVYLLLRRFLLPHVRVISGFEDYASIALILAVVFTGDLMRFGSHFDLNQARECTAGLLSLNPGPVPADPRFLLHFLLAQILIMYIPFSKFLHIPGVFFSKSLLYET